jgi:hypothetical protein
MIDLIHESGWGAWFSLILTLAGIAAVLTVGRRTRRPGSIAAAWAVAILASGAMGVGSGQRAVDAYVHDTPAADLAKRVEAVSVGTREASANLLLSGGCAMIVLAIGGTLALIGTRKTGGAPTS